MQGPGFAGHAHSVIVQQVVQPEPAAHLTVRAGPLVQLHERTLGELDEELGGVAAGDLAGVIPERLRGGFGHGTVGVEHGQFGKAGFLRVGQRVVAGLHRVPDGAMLFVGFAAILGKFQIGFAQRGENVRPRMSGLGHAAAQGDGERQAATFAHDFMRCRRQIANGHRMFLGGDGIGEQLLCFRFGEERDGHEFAVDGVENALVARGDEHPAARAEHVEGLRVRRLPNVVEDEQHGFGSEQFAEPALALRQRIKPGVAAEMPDEVALALEQIVAREILSARNPDDAVRIGLAHLVVARERGSQHGFADAAHALHPHARIGAGDDLWLLKIHEQRVAHSAKKFWPSQKIWRQTRHAEKSAELGVRMTQTGDELGERGGVVGVVPEILAVQQAQFAGDVLFFANTEYRRDDHMVTFQSELPFFSNIRRHRRLRPADVNHAVHLGANGVLDLLMKT